LFSRAGAGVLAAAVIFLACSGEYDGAKPAYDTARNPGQFPPPATALLDDLEAGRLRGYDETTERFADLYTAHPALLGDPGWSGVIDRLGLRLTWRGDQLVREGLLQYAAAADLYRLAAQTRPKDSLLSERAELFAAWQEAVGRGAVDPVCLAAPGRGGAAEKLEALTGFALAGARQFRFAEQYLAAALFDRATLDSLRRAEAAGPTAAERALRAALGAGPSPADPPLASFRQPAVDLIAVRLTPAAADSFCLEAYFLPRAKVSADLDITCRLETPDPVLSAEQQPRFPYDFRPVRPSSMWAPGRIAVGLYRGTFPHPVSAVLIGLHEMREGRTVALPLGDRSTLCRVPVGASGGTPDPPL